MASLDDLRQSIRSRRARAWVGAVVSASSDPAPGRLLYAQIVVGTRPPEWSDRTWSYEQCKFFGLVLSAAKTAALFGAGGEPGQMTLDSGVATIEVPESTWSWQRAASMATFDDLTLAWPSVAYRIGMVSQPPFQAPTGYLVGQGSAPSFPTFGAAFQAFFRGDFAVSGSSNPQLGQLAVRLVDQRARITRVRIRPASVDVWVGGRGLRGVRLEFNSTDHRATITIPKSGRIAVPLPHGLPPDSWLWMKDERDWLDFRSLSGWGGRMSPDVETDLPRDPLADLSRLIAQGEGTQLEYKVKLPDTRDEKRHVFKTVVAFANGDGGTLLFGVGDNGDPHGVNGNLSEQRRRLNDLLRDLIAPSLHPRISAHRLDGKNILVLEIPPSTGTLHALTLDANRPEYYVRRDGTTYFARPDELAATAQRSLLGGAGWSLPGS